MQFTTLLLSSLGFLSYALAAPAAHTNHDEDEGSRQLRPRGDWPDFLKPRVRVYRYTDCEHNDRGTDVPNGYPLQAHELQVDKCYTFEKALKKAKAQKQHYLDELSNDPDVTEDDLLRAEHPEDYITEAMYWQLPKATQESIMQPAARCNVTIFSETNCKAGSRIVKVTNEAQNVCVPAHKGKSIRVDCYTQKELDAQVADGIGPTEEWKKSGILRYGEAIPGSASPGAQKSWLLPPVDPMGNYDKYSYENARTLAGRNHTKKALFRDRLEDCEKDEWDDCTWGPGPNGWCGATCP